MKKLLTFVLAVVMMFTLSLNVVAVEDTLEELSGSSSKSITLTVNNNSSYDPATSPTYSVTVAWTDTAMTYTISEDDGKVIWDPVNHVYTSEGGSISSTFEDSQAVVTVTNHSDAKVQASIKLDGITNSMTVDGVTFTCEGETTRTLLNAAEVAYGVTDKDQWSEKGLVATFNINASGTPEIISGSITVNATVTIIAVDEP